MVFLVSCSAWSISLPDLCLLAYGQEKIRKRRLFKKVQVFCEEKVLRYLLGVFWYAETKKQCCWLKMASLVYNLHVSKMAAKLKKYKSVV